MVPGRAEVETPPDRDAPGGSQFYIGGGAGDCQGQGDAQRLASLAIRPAPRDVGRMSKGFTSGFAPEDAAQPRRSYHHGNLREALIEAARALLAEKGPEGFTLVDAARAAGVSPAAPYRHFRDKDALLAAVATEGFRDFARHQQSALAGQSDPLSAFRAMGLAYLAFAEENPGAYLAMFASRGGVHEAVPHGNETGGGFDALLHGLRTMIGDPPPPGIDPLGLACQVWALSHGVAMLSANGMLQRSFGRKPQDLLLEGVERLVKGALKR
jgi:AcrR family transcriptional regulator